MTGFIATHPADAVPETAVSVSTPAPTENNLLTATLLLHEARQEESRYREAVQSALDEWDDSRPGWIAELEAELARHRELRKDAEVGVRSLALQVAKASGTRKFICGVEVVSTSSWHWQDEDSVLAWARQSGIGLKLDTMAIEKVAAASPGVVPGIVRVPGLGTRIAADLSLSLGAIGALPDAPANAGGVS